MNDTRKNFRVGLVGWGLGGRYFHAPFIQTTKGLELTAVVTSRTPEPDLFPQVQVAESFAALLADPGLDLIVLASPNRLHLPQAVAALRAGKHVVVEKPIAATSAEAQTIIREAETAGRLFIPFQNRRWDGDFLTVQKLLAADALGDVTYYESHWPRYEPVPQGRATWKSEPDVTHGLLYDLGPHLIDQVICLFGPPQTVYAQIETQRLGSAADDLMRLNLHFASGLHALLEIDMLNPCPVFRFHLRGKNGVFQKMGLDPQEDRLVAGEMPGGADWGREDSYKWGQLWLNQDDVDLIETEPGDYGGFYRGVVSALRRDGPVPVSPHEVVWQLQVIEAALRSSETGEVQWLAPVM